MYSKPVRIALVALTLTLVGLWLTPMLDHHVAERLPHVHLSAADDGAQHRHAYETLTMA